MKTNEYRSLIHHMEWADAQIWRSVLILPSLKHDTWIKKCLHHFHSTQWAFGQIILSLPLNIPEFDSFPDLKSVAFWARRFYSEISENLIGLSEADFEKNIDIPWSTRIAEQLGKVVPATAGECIMQLTLHTMHHRGQVAMYLRQVGGEPPPIDFIAWIWMQRPAPDWGLIEVT